METRNLQVLCIILFASSCFHSISAESRVYIVHMDSSAMPRAFLTHYSWYSATLSSISDNSEPPKLIHTYTNSIHGFSAKLTLSQLEALKNSPSYISSTPDRPLKLHTTHTSQFLGLSSSSGAWPASHYGEDVIIGLIDSGIWPESESFNDKGMSKVPSRWKGKCVAGTQFNSSLCNKKLIGARFYNKGYLEKNPDFKIEMNSSRDTDGHGTHTASTAAGRFVEGASYFGYGNGTATGTAPMARIAIYKVVWNQGIVESDVLAAIDQAIEDGVDILSISLAFGYSDEVNYFLEDDIIAVATFAAMKKGIFVAASAGNDGSNTGTLANGAPWVVTVGAGTVDREFAGTITLGNGVKISFETLYPGNYSSDQVPIVFVDGCLDVKELKRHKNKIVVCKDNLSISDQVANVNSANVYGGIFITNITLSDYYTRDSGFLSAFIGLEDGQEVIDYIKNSTNIIPKAKLEFGKTILGTKPAPKVDSYSSRGPFPSCPNVLKPDILAPGTSILASWSPTSWVAKVKSQAVHPDWSPAAIRSAIMTTANPLDNTQTPINDVAENDDKPANSLGIGSGHIEPNKALNPGLIYEAETEDYINFLCAFNYTAKQIRIITGSAQSCANSSLHLNYPSFIAYFIGDKKSTKAKVVQEFRRTVTNVGEESSSYTANLTSMAGLNVKVEPQRLVFRKKFEKLSYKLSLEGPKLLKDEVVQGSLTWVEDSGKYVVRSPILATNIDPKSFLETPLTTYNCSFEQMWVC
nr:subtilisin-like protease SBT1.9 isoform X2 [Ziziphus jujuba var. spinosa]